MLKSFKKSFFIIIIIILILLENNLIFSSAPIKIKSIKTNNNNNNKLSTTQTPTPTPTEIIPLYYEDKNQFDVTIKECEFSILVPFKQCTLIKSPFKKCPHKSILITRSTTTTNDFSDYKVSLFDNINCIDKNNILTSTSTKHVSINCKDQKYLSKNQNHQKQQTPQTQKEIKVICPIESPVSSLSTMLTSSSTITTLIISISIIVLIMFVKSNH